MTELTRHHESEDRLTSSASAAHAAEARASVVRTQAVVDQHLLHEETDLEPVMLSHEDTAEQAGDHPDEHAARPALPPRDRSGLEGVTC